jgi:hypothetical protein
MRGHRNTPPAARADAGRITVHLFLDICQGLGLGAAAGLRPFFPAVVAGLFGVANWGVNFTGTSYAFLESPIWIVLVLALMIATFLLRRSREAAPVDAAVGGASVGVGALLFAGTLADHGHDSTGWTILGLVAGAACAVLAAAAVRDLSGRVAGRLDEQSRNALPLWFDAVGLVLAALAIALPPVSLVALPFLAWLRAGGRRREGGKYAGLRILR